jgi:hypothetical protein
MKIEDMKKELEEENIEKNHIKLYKRHFTFFN